MVGHMGLAFQAVWEGRDVIPGAFSFFFYLFGL